MLYPIILVFLNKVLCRNSSGVTLFWDITTAMQDERAVHVI